MRLHSFLRHSLQVLLPLAFALTLQLYFYHIFRGCAFPSTNGSLKTAFADTLAQHSPFSALNKHASSSSLAPFRLLVLADPQLEGDSSLPPPEDELGPRLKEHLRTLNAAETSKFRSVAFEVLRTIVLEDVPRVLFTLRKRIDLWGNDYYLAHIFRTLNWWTKPTHVTVLGDLIGSQWISDGEFDWRGWRYWNRVFAGGKRVEDDITSLAEGQAVRTLPLDDASWKSRIINVAGNHDIGYAGDVSEDRMNRFERVFGKANWDIKFQYPKDGNASGDTAVIPSLHLIVLNSLVLDTPAFSEDIQKETYGYLNSVISDHVEPVEDRSTFTLLLTHLPLFKKRGICVDGYHFDYWNDDDGDCDGNCRPNGLKEQNHLSLHASQPGVLEALFGMKADTNAAAAGKGRNGLILTGHDHEGCDTWHFINSSTTFDSMEEADKDRSTLWDSVRWRDADFESSHTGIREVTLRSMMGDFGGNAGLLSAWYDFDVGEWKYDIQMCRFGVQHIWWAVHVIDLIALLAIVVNITFFAVNKVLSTSPIKEKPIIPKGKQP